MPISVLNNGTYECEDNVYIGLPAVLNKDGVHHIVKLELDDTEKHKLNHSATLLRDILDSINY